MGILNLFVRDFAPIIMQHIVAKGANVVVRSPSAGICDHTVTARRIDLFL